MNVTDTHPELEALKFISRRHAAELLDTSTQQIDRMLKRGELTGIKIGPRGIRIRMSSLKRLIGS